MNRKIKTMIQIILFLIIVFMSKTVLGASGKISTNKSQIEVGQTATITVNINQAAAWDFSINTGGMSSSGDLIYADASSNARNTSFSKTVSVISNKPGVYAISLSGTVTDENDEKSPLTGSVTITVTAASTPSNNNEDDDNLPTASNGGTTTTVKSSNNYLKSLSLSAGSISFNRKTTKYTVNVPENTESITVTGTAEHEKATVQGNGTVNLKKGNNTIHVVVTAENGAARTYTLTVVRAGQPETTSEEEQQPGQQNPEDIVGLTSLKLKGVKDNGEIVELLLTPEFSKDIFYYECQIPEGVTFIDVQQENDILDAIVEVTGNDNLVEGENLINIIIQYTDENGEEQIITYQVSAKKEAVGGVQEIEEEDQGLNPWQIGIIAGSIGIATIIIIVLIVKYCRQQKKSGDDLDFGGYGEPFYSVEDEEDIFEKPIGELKRKEAKAENSEQTSLESDENKIVETQQDIDNWEEFEPVKKKRKIFGKNAKNGKHF